MEDVEQKKPVMPGQLGVATELVRFGITGVMSNVVLFLGYVLLTELGVGHKTAMTALYLLGVIQTFVFNRQWTFRHSGPLTLPMLRYLAVYALGYFVNLFCLMLFVDFLGMPHLIVQASVILPIAALIFVLQKYWVFSTASAQQCVKSET